MLGIGVEFGVLNPFSRRHELEADRIGLDYMNAAGYRPSEALEFWRAMSTAGGAQPPAILSTHPANAERITGIRDHILARGYA